MAQAIAIQKWGNSQGIRIPKAILETLNWKNDEKINIKAESGKIVIEKAIKRKNIRDLFEDYDGDYIPIEFDWGTPVGGEIW